ncbi:MAG: asparagine synthase (glutamine-hydrolyzing) [Bacteroidetes bacterium]|jgi:asparagine synthase (glutamine-hydrolysing)|nr:asparagine synthase (glutamine-hydrolyzing) [Bacteroidota bacterium]
MCGIAGLISFSSKPVSSEQLNKISEIIKHRGPDGEGFWINSRQNVGLAHRRLAIIDLSEDAAQPMHYNNRYTIVFNGEIYNYIELRSSLEKNGYRFRTQSDTEVILAAYDYKGEKCLADFDGMFAFAIWDNKTEKLFIARDRFGEKPLFYYFDKDQFVFASEIKALTKSGFKTEVNRESVNLYLNENMSNFETETFFKNIHKLPRSHYATISDGKLTIHRYYDLNYNTVIRYKTDDEYSEHFKELFELSIKRRLRSDVPVATSFSGGLDSSGIVCMLHKMYPELNYTLFSARFDDNAKDEGKWMKLITDNIHFKQVNKWIEPDEIKEKIEKIVYHCELPIGSTSVCAQYLLMEHIKNSGVKVILDGQGADEMLAGYGHYRYHYMNEWLYNFKIREYFKEKESYKQLYGQKLPTGVIPKLKLYLSKVIYPGQEETPLYKSFKAVLRDDMINDFQLLLTFSDRNSMAHGIEVRLPFLYHELVEYVFSLPKEQIYRNSVTKYIYRNAMKSIIPDEVRLRKDKLGFAPPQDKWMHKFTAPANGRIKEQGYSLSDNPWRNYITEVFLKVAAEKF